MQRAFADAEEQNRFRKRIEAMLREGEPEAALALVRQGLKGIAGSGLRIVDIALAADPHAVALKGWNAVAATIAREEARGKQITALSIDLSCHGGYEPDAGGHLAPYIETNYFEDLHEIAFSTASREELLAGHSGYGTEWQGCFVDIDGAIEVEGLSALYGAMTAVKGTRDSDDAEGDAYLLAACTNAILFYISVCHAIAAGALPRPMAVLVGSNDEFPFFDAPAVSIDEARALMPDRPIASPPEPAAPASPPESAEKGFFGKLFGR